MNTFLVQIEEITFDLEDDEMDYDEEINLQAMLQEVYINKTYKISAETEEEAHDELMEIVTDDTGWCIHSMTSVTL
jgi:hypothetical protein